MKRVASLACAMAIHGVATAEVPHSFQPDTPALAGEVNANFSSLDTRVTDVTEHLFALEQRIAVLEETLAEVPDLFMPRVVDASGKMVGYVHDLELDNDEQPIDVALPRPGGGAVLFPVDAQGARPDDAAFGGPDCTGPVYFFSHESVGAQGTLLRGYVQDGVLYVPNVSQGLVSAPIQSSWRNFGSGPECSNDSTSWMSMKDSGLDATWTLPLELVFSE